MGIGIHEVLKGGVIKGCPDQGLQVNLEGMDHLWECQWVGALGEGLCHGY